MTSFFVTSRVARTGLAGICLAFATAGCDDFLSVDNPGSITTQDLDNPQLLPAIRLLPEAAGAEDHDSFVRAVGLIGPDLTEWQTRQTDLDQDWGNLELQNSALEGLYNNLAADVWVVREARRRLEVLEPNPAQSVAIATSYFWDAHLLVSMADVFKEITIEGGAPNTPVATYQIALDILEEGVQKSSGLGVSADYIAAYYSTMARVERQLFFEPGGTAANLTRAAGYAAQALATKGNYRLDARFVPPGGTNQLQVEFGPNRGLTPLGVEGTFGEGWTDPVTDAPDPRIVAAVSGVRGTGPQGNLYYLTKYADNGSPIPVARWQEAVLIIAEERLEADDLPAAVDRINEVRSAAGLTTFSSSDPARILEQIQYERQVEFFAEGRNWTDMRNYEIFPPLWKEEARAAGHRRAPISPREAQTNPNY